MNELIIVQLIAVGIIGGAVALIGFFVGKRRGE